MFKYIAISVLLAFLTTFNAHADTLTFAVGKDRKSEKKTLQLTYSYVPFEKIKFLTLDGTLATYHRYDFLAGMPSSYIGELGVGIEARNSVLYAKIGQAISYGTRGMHYVGDDGYDAVREKLQYATKLSAGITADKVNLGLFFKHYSDGKHTATNGCGVNFIGFELGYVLGGK